MIKIYTLAECPKCLVAKRFLKSRSIAYEEINAETCKDFLKKKGFMELPIIEIDGKFINFEQLVEVKE